MPVAVDLRFSSTEESRSSYHGYANLLNVVHAELQLLERMSTPGPALRPVIRLCEIAARAVKHRSLAVEHCGALTEFKSRIRTALSHLDIQARYENDASEACGIIEQVIDSADLRVQETVARHAVPRPAERHGAREAESLLGAIAPSAEIRVTADLLVPHGIPEAVGRLAAVLAETGPVRVEVSSGQAHAAPASAAQAHAAEASAAETIIDVHASGGLDPALVPGDPPLSFEADGVSNPVPALLALIFYLVTPRGELTINTDGTPLVRLCFGPNR